MNWFNKKAILALTVAVIAGMSVYVIQHRRIGRAVAEQKSALAAFAQRSSDNQANTDSLKETEQQIRELRKETRELPRLRNQVTQLRQQKNVNEVSDGSAVPGNDATHQPLPPGKYISKEQLAFAGYETPEASAQSGTWSLVAGNYEVRTNLLGSNFSMDREQFEAQSRNMQWGLKGLQILARKSVSHDTVELKVRMDSQGESSVLIWRLLKVGNEWKDGGSIGSYTAAWDSTGTIQAFTP